MTTEKRTPGRRVHVIEDPKKRDVASAEIRDVIAKEAEPKHRAFDLANELRTVIAKALQRKTYQGIEVVIDRPKGFVQTGKNEKGEEWSREYKCDYGFIKRTTGGDGEELDVFLGDVVDAHEVYWARQVKFDGSFDEYKIFLGFESRKAAKACYEAHIPKELLSAMFATPIDALKSLLGLTPDGVMKGAKPEGKSFVEHAQNWLESRGLFDADEMYGGALGKAVMRMVETFSDERHSGNSALWARSLFNSVCDAWDGMNTMLLNDEDYKVALEALCEEVEKAVGSLNTCGEISEATTNRFDARVIQIGKAAEDERYVLGIVLEPEVVDSQGDIYSADEIKKAAYAYMSDFQNIGLQHKQLINNKVTLLESYLAPVDMEIHGSVIRAGTWMMAVRFEDHALWSDVKLGRLTGFSIGGLATKTKLDAS